MKIRKSGIGWEIEGRFRLRPLLLAAGVLLSGAGVAMALPGDGAPRTPAAVELPPPSPIAKEEFAARRAAFMGSLPGDGVFVAFGSPAPPQDYLPYEQSPQFRYLTGIVEPSVALVLVRTGGTTQEHLFLRPRDPAREIWEGYLLGTEGGTERTGIPARSLTNLVPMLDSLMGVHNTLYTLVQVHPDPLPDQQLTYEQQVLGRLAARHPRVELRPVDNLLARVRATKSPAELDRIRRAVLISAEAHREAMKAVRPGMNEFEIKGLVEYFFLRNGAERPAYSSIVGSGPNSTTLHYRDADRFMEDGEVLLIDVGASYDGYAADVTRTIPVNGRFSQPQREVYAIVLRAQKAAEALVRPGASWRELNEAATREIAVGLAELGLIDAAEAAYDCGASRCSQVRLWYMHGLGHGVGLAVHDPDISTFDGFQPGSAVSIEPGIYVRGDAFDHLTDTPGNREMIARLRPVWERYRDIGVRIEDIFIFDESGIERVSAAAPREMDEIEALMREEGMDLATRRADMVEWFRGLRGHTGH